MIAPGYACPLPLTFLDGLPLAPERDEASPRSPVAEPLKVLEAEDCGCWCWDVVVPETVREEGVVGGLVLEGVVVGGKNEVLVWLTADTLGECRPGLIIVPAVGMAPFDGGPRYIWFTRVLRQVH